jgi:hypothetical protein
MAFNRNQGTYYILLPSSFLLISFKTYTYSSKASKQVMPMLCPLFPMIDCLSFVTNPLPLSILVGANSISLLIFLFFQSFHLPSL